MTVLAAAVLLPFLAAVCPPAAPLILLGVLVLAQVERSALL